MPSLSFKSLVVYVAIFCVTLVTGVSLVGKASPSVDEAGFEFGFGRGHRAKDLKMENELERMNGINEKLIERLELLEKKLEGAGANGLNTVPALPAIPEVPRVNQTPGAKAQPVTPQAQPKVSDQASF